MREITLGNRKEIEVLKVNIGEESYTVPLAGSLSVKEANAINSEEKAVAFLQKHIPKKVLENLTVDDLNALVNAWYGESTKNGAKVGES